MLSKQEELILSF